MSGRVEALAWDTEFFGVPIGRASLEDATPELLVEIEAEARDLGLACLYGSLDPRRSEAVLAVERSPWRLVDVGILLDRDPSLPYPTPDAEGVGRFGTPDDLPDLRETVDRLAPWSRYAMDPRFGREAAARLLQAWVARAADPSNDRYALHVVEDETGITSFATLEYEPLPRIDLIGARRSGSGSAQALMAFTLGVTRGKVLGGGPIAARNVQSLRYTESSGFRTRSSRYNYHRWLDDEGGARP